MSEPITRSEMYLAALGGEVVTPPAPITRMDMYLAYLNGMTDTYPEPITRTEQYLYKLCQNGMGGGGGVTIRNQNKTITENGTYRHDTGYTGLGTVTVNVPQEDPVLQDKTVTENGTVTADAGFDGLGVVTVNVEASGGGDDLARAIVERTITEYNDSEILTLGKYAFYFCSSLQKVNTPLAIKVLDHAFNGCSELSVANFPAVQQINSNAFEACAFTSIEFPEATRLGNNMFKNCTNLQEVILAKAAGIPLNAFYGCANMSTLVLRNETLVSLTATNAFDKTPFASGGTGGTVYCPASLITQYQQATNWATLYAAGTCNFVAIEGSEYE